jgi:hypothetical protein
MMQLNTEIKNKVCLKIDFVNMKQKLTIHLQAKSCLNYIKNIISSKIYCGFEEIQFKVFTRYQKDR